MFELTPKHFVDLVEKLYQDKKIPFGKNQKIHHYEDGFYFHLTLFFQLSAIVCEENVHMSLFKNEPLFCIICYYKYYVEAFGKEPYNLAQELYDAIELGVMYGEGKDNNFNVCTSKKLNNNKLTVKCISCTMLDVLRFYEETTVTYDLSPSNRTVCKNPYLISIIFEFPNKDSFDKIDKEIKTSAKLNRITPKEINKILAAKNECRV